MLAGLTFIGGTCLRACYGSARLSEDLDFTGGNDFNRRDLWDIGWLVQQGVELPTRLIPLKVRDTVEKQAYWQYLTQVIDEQATLAITGLG